MVSNVPIVPRECELGSGAAGISKGVEVVVVGRLSVIENRKDGGLRQSVAGNRTVELF